MKSVRQTTAMTWAWLTSRSTSDVALPALCDSIFVAMNECPQSTYYILELLRCFSTVRSVSFVSPVGPWHHASLALWTSSRTMGALQGSDWRDWTSTWASFLFKENASFSSFIYMCLYYCDFYFFILFLIFWLIYYLNLFFTLDLESWVCLTVIALLTLASWGNPAYDRDARRKLVDACSDRLKPVATYVADLVLHHWRWMVNNETLDEDDEIHQSFIVLLSCPVFELWEKDVLKMNFYFIIN